MFKKTLSAITALVIMTSGLSAEGTKDIVVQPTNHDMLLTEAQEIDPAPSTEEYSDTIVYASAVKNYYEPYEPIQIKVKLKRDAYIYLWSISASGEGCLILPNNLGTEMLHSADQEHIIPQSVADYEFVSDREGIENIYVLATSKKLNTKSVKEIFKKKAGNFSLASNKDLKSFITKDIVVIARINDLKYNMTSFQIEVNKPHSDSTVNITVNR